MPRVRRRAKERHELTHEQLMEFWLGPNGRNGSAFASDQERKAAWDYHKWSVLKGHENPTRLWAWRQYEAGRKGNNDAA